MMTEQRSIDKVHTIHHDEAIDAVWLICELADGAYQSNDYGMASELRVGYEVVKQIVALRDRIVERGEKI
jgi:hypothetical protein